MLPAKPASATINQKYIVGGTELQYNLEKPVFSEWFLWHSTSKKRVRITKFLHLENLDRRAVKARQ